MRALLTVLMVALAAARPVPTAGQDDAGVDPVDGVSHRGPVVLSDLLTHSSLVECRRPDREVARQPKRLRIATWNIHAARSSSLDAITAELQAMQADVIALQEVDVRTRRSGFVDAPKTLATALGFHYVFAASIKWNEGDYGIAVLSRWPLNQVQRHRLDSPAPFEPRIVLQVGVCADGRPLHVFNHHADVRAAARSAGFGQLARIVETDSGHPRLVVGDFNEPADGASLRRLLGAGLVDLGAHHAIATIDGRRVDYVLADSGLARLMSTIRVWRTDKSDHDAVLADFKW